MTLTNCVWLSPRQVNQGIPTHPRAFPFRMEPVLYVGTPCESATALAVQSFIAVRVVFCIKRIAANHSNSDAAPCFAPTKCLPDSPKLNSPKDPPANLANGILVLGDALACGSAGRSSDYPWRFGTRRMSESAHPLS